MTRSSELWMLVWPFFGNKSSLKILFVSFWGWSYNMLGDFYPSKCYITKKGPKKLSDFECCAVLTHSTQFQWLVWPIFGSKTCLRTLFRGYWGWYFDFLGWYLSLNNLYYKEMAKTCPYLASELVFAKYGLKIELHCIQSYKTPIFLSKFRDKAI